MVRPVFFVILKFRSRRFPGADADADAAAEEWDKISFPKLQKLSENFRKLGTGISKPKKFTLALRNNSQRGN